MSGASEDGAACFWLETTNWETEIPWFTWLLQRPTTIWERPRRISRIIQLEVKHARAGYGCYIISW